MEGNSNYLGHQIHTSWDLDDLMQYHPTPSSSIAIVPSTAREWNAQRSRIAHLYGELNLPLKHVQKIMERDYNFKATKRMYTTRIKQWKLCKNYRAAEKELLATRIVEAQLESRPISDFTFKNRPVKLDRVLRHLRARKRNNDARTKTTTNGGRSLVDQKSFSDIRTSIDSQVEMGPILATNCEQSTTIALEFGTPRDTTWTVLTPPAQSDELDDAFEMIERSDVYPKLPEPTPPLSFPKGAINTELILHQTHVYYHDRLGGVSSEDVDPQHCSASFWWNIKTGIYFLQKQHRDLAWPLLNKACLLATEIFSDTPLVFLNDVFTILSPVNTTNCPQIRGTILRYLASVACSKFQSAQHPLVVVLRELASDNQHTAASETAPSLTLVHFAQVLGADHTATFAVHHSLVRLLRRDKRLTQAQEQAELLVEKCEQALVSTTEFTITQAQKPTISMTEFCIALTELPHIRIDQQAYVLAKTVCASALRQHKLREGVDFPLNRAACLMEDMAEISRRMGNRDEAADWLRHALSASCRIRGAHGPQTEHIRNKLLLVLDVSKEVQTSDHDLDYQMEGHVAYVGALAIEDHTQLMVHDRSLRERGRARAFEICPFIRTKVLAGGKLQ